MRYPEAKNYDRERLSRKVRAYSRLYLKPETFDRICWLRQWKKRGRYSRFSEALGVSRPYGTSIAKGEMGLSHAWIIYEIAKLAGCDFRSCWCHLFEVRVMELDPSHPMFVELKYLGIMESTSQLSEIKRRIAHEKNEELGLDK